MGLLKSDAIVLRTFDYSETSYIVWFFTRNYGRLHAIAKGAKRARSEFEGALEPFVHCTIEVYRKEKRDLDILGSIDLKDIRLKFRASYERMICANQIVELLCETIQVDDANPEFFDYVVEVFTSIANASIDQLTAHVLAFEANLLRAIGIFPALTHCVESGEDLTKPSKVHFDARKGGVISAKFGGDQPRVRRSTLELFEALSSGLNPDELTLESKTALELRQMLNDYWKHQLEKKLKMGLILEELIP